MPTSYFRPGRVRLRLPISARWSSPSKFLLPANTRACWSASGPKPNGSRFQRDKCARSVVDLHRDGLAFLLAAALFFNSRSIEAIISSAFIERSEGSAALDL